MGAERRDDLPRLDAEAPDAELVVEPAEEHDLSVGIDPYAVAGAVAPPSTVQQEPLGGQLGGGPDTQRATAGPPITSSPRGPGGNR